MTKYIHLGLPKEAVDVLDAKAKQNYLKRVDVARQYLLKALLDETVADLRKKGYSIRKIAESLNVSTRQVLEALRNTGVDEALYGEDDEEEKTLARLLKGK
ncbi:hypothetical protein HY572_04290 [Candidatus Micrarchaeota archaeon]|nr:hypothetical protein [Candidatus Micrarchaeota archaeon]